MQYQMPPELTKEERAMLNELPPLPRSDYTDNGGFGQDRALALFTGSQMRSYALEAVRLERERCARICDDELTLWMSDMEEDQPQGLTSSNNVNISIKRIAAAIRSGTP